MSVFFNSVLFWNTSFHFKMFTTSKWRVYLLAVYCFILYTWQLFESLLFVFVNIGILFWFVVFYLLSLCHLLWELQRHTNKLVWFLKMWLKFITQKIVWSIILNHSQTLPTIWLNSKLLFGRGLAMSPAVYQLPMEHMTVTLWNNYYSQWNLQHISGFGYENMILKKIRVICY